MPDATVPGLAATLICINGLMSFALGVTTPFFSIYLRSKGLPMHMVGTVQAAATAVAAAGAIVVGILTDKVRTRRLLLGLFVSQALCLLVAAASCGPGVLSVAIVCLAATPHLPVMKVLIMRTPHSGARTRLMSLFLGVFTLSYAVVAPAFASFFLGQYTIRECFWLGSLVAILCALWVRALPDTLTDEACHDAQPRREPVPRIVLLTLVGPGLAFLCSGIAGSVVLTFIPVLATDTAGLSTMDFSKVLAIGCASVPLAHLLSGRIRTTLPSSSSVKVAIVISALVLPVLGACWSIVSMTVCLALFNFAVASKDVDLHNVVVERVPAAYLGKVVALQGVATGLGRTCYNLVGGMLWDTLGVQATLGVAALIMIASMGFWGVIDAHLARHAPQKDKAGKAYLS